MTRTRNVEWFDRQNYDAVKRLVADDSMPDTFDQWLEESGQRIREWEAAGIVVEKVVINAQQFAAWCRASGVNNDLASLGAFVVAMARKQRENRA